MYDGSRIVAISIRKKREADKAAEARRPKVVPMTRPEPGSAFPGREPPQHGVPGEGEV